MVNEYEFEGKDLDELRQLLENDPAGEVFDAIRSTARRVAVCHSAQLAYASSAFLMGCIHSALAGSRGIPVAGTLSVLAAALDMGWIFFSATHQEDADRELENVLYDLPGDVFDRMDARKVRAIGKRATAAAVLALVSVSAYTAALLRYVRAAEGVLSSGFMCLGSVLLLVSIALHVTPMSYPGKLRKLAFSSREVPDSKEDEDE